MLSASKNCTITLKGGDKLINIGENIRKIRQDRGMKQDEFAKKADISRSYLGDLENNRKSPSLDTLQKLANNMDISLSYLLTGKKTIRDFNKDEQESYVKKIKNDSDDNYLKAQYQLTSDIANAMAYEDITKIYHNWENVSDDLKFLFNAIFSYYEEKPDESILHDRLAQFILELYASDQKGIEDKIIVLDRKYENLKKEFIKSEERQPTGVTDGDIIEMLKKIDPPQT